MSKPPTTAAGFTPFFFFHHPVVFQFVFFSSKERARHARIFLFSSSYPLPPGRHPGKSSGKTAAGVSPHSGTRRRGENHFIKPIFFSSH